MAVEGLIVWLLGEPGVVGLAAGLIGFSLGGPGGCRRNGVREACGVVAG